MFLVYGLVYRKIELRIVCGNNESLPRAGFIRKFDNDWEWIVFFFIAIIWVFCTKFVKSANNYVVTIQNPAAASHKLAVKTARLSRQWEELGGIQYQPKPMLSEYRLNSETNTWGVLQNRFKCWFWYCLNCFGRVRMPLIPRWPPFFPS